ncbi:hypothetical protein GIW81_15680 [Hyphomicrobium sp. xq]|uniref:Uncharacterized protein n=1 Tax=Hyphomicrobium album TaxID=2665159 RepID=A0A6I3KMU4_9HYPH|nr:hypothetical protein [Hyphomicrobium album]MTD95779.1 hypothetical protein [Hyphomicrobium album]
MLDRMWTANSYFCREPGHPNVKFACTNDGGSVGLQGSNAMPERVSSLNRFFETYRAGDEYDTAVITPIMACSSHLPGALINAARQHALGA